MLRNAHVGNKKHFLVVQSLQCTVAMMGHWSDCAVIAWFVPFIGGVDKSLK